MILDLQRMTGDRGGSARGARGGGWSGGRGGRGGERGRGGVREITAQTTMNNILYQFDYFIDNYSF